MNDQEQDTELAVGDARRRGAGHFVVVALEWLAGLIGLTLVALALVFARLAYGPLSTDLLTPLIERAIAGNGAGLTPSIAHSELTWDRAGRHLEMRLDGTVLANGENETVLAAPEVSFRLAVPGLLLGRLDVSDVHVNGLNLRLERTGEGQLTFYGVMPLPQPSPIPPKPLSEVLASLPHQLGSLGRHLAQLRDLTVSAVEISLVDRTQAQGDAAAPTQIMTLPDLVIHQADGRVTGNASLNLALQPVPLVANLTVDMEAATGTGEVKLSWEKTNLSTLGGLAPGLSSLSGFNLPLSGSVTVDYTGNRKNSPIQATLQLAAESGTVIIPGLMPDKTPVKAASTLLTVRATEKDGILSAVMRNTMIDLNGPLMTATLDLAPAEALLTQQRQLQLEATLKNVPVDRLDALWPPQLAAGARDWVVQHLHDGTAEATFKMDAEVNWPALDSFKISQLGGTIGMDGTTVNYLPDLPPVVNAAATATYDADQMKIDISGGSMNSVTVLPSTVTIGLLTETLAMEVNGAGALPRILEAIDKPPLGYTGKIGLKPGDMTGDASFKMDLAFPLLADLPIEQVKIGLVGTVTHFASDQLVSGFALADGVLKLALTTEQLDVSGPVNINNVPSTITWQEDFDAAPGAGSLATVSTVLSNEMLHNAGISGDYIGGDMPVTVKYASAASGDTADISADLTPGELKLAPLGYSKPAGKSGRLTAKIRFPASTNKIAPIQVTSLTATADGLNLVGKANLLRNPVRIQNIAITRGQFGGNSLKADLSRLESRTGAAGWQGTVDAGTLDFTTLRSPDNANKQERLPPLDLTLRAQKAIFGEGRSVAPLRAILKRDGKSWQQVEVEMTAGDVPFSVRLLPVFGGGQSLHVETPDLGRVLRATDQTDTIIDGKLLIEGASKGPGEPLEATLDLRDYRIRNMPFAASLISAISAEGLLNALSREEGLSFSRLRGKISWQGDTIALDNVKTSGGALGLTVEGKIDTYQETVDLQGTAVPFNSVNSLLGNVPIVGAILGGSSGVFAATYKASGPLDAIHVSVNPLSILAPGFLRDLFFIEG